MDKFFFDSEFDSCVQTDGWLHIDAGSSKRFDYNSHCAVYVKAVPVADVFKMSALQTSENPAISRENTLPPETVMGYYKTMGGRMDECCLLTNVDLDRMFGVHSDILSAMQCDTTNNNIVIASSCFWIDNPNNIISYNYCLVFNGLLLSFLFFPFSDVNSQLSIDYMLGRILDFLDEKRTDRRTVTHYQYISELNDKGHPIVNKCDKYTDAVSNAKYAFIDGLPSSILISTLPKNQKYERVLTCFEFNSDEKISITMVSFHGLQFLSSVNTRSAYSTNILTDQNIREHEHGLFTSKPINLAVNSFVNNGWNYIYQICLNIRDAANHDCIGNATPHQLGEIAGCKQSNPLPAEYEDKLDDFFVLNPNDFMDCAAERCSDILMYLCVIWGFNRDIPATITSAACRVAKTMIATEFSCPETQFPEKYSGTIRFKGKLRQTMKQKFHRNGCMMPLNDDVDSIQRYSAKAFRGGYNGCFSVDVHHNKETYDLDLCGAYPTAMALVPAIDWSDCINTIYHRGHKLCMDDFIVDGEINPMAPIFAAVTYEFPADCRFPCLPRNDEDDDEAPAYPLRENKPVYCSGPELYIALKLGAVISVNSGYKANVLRDNNGNIVYPYRNTIKKIVSARIEAESECGKKSLDAKILKLCVNMIYGKTAQFVGKIYSNNSETSGNESEISNSVSATLTTSFVRATLFSAFNEIYTEGFDVYSATTDGLITNMPFSDFRKLDLFGLTEYLSFSRKQITGNENAEIWAIKHTQNDLMNFTTRGNASFITENASIGRSGGVFAKNGISSAFPNCPKESFENRKAFIKNVVGRTERIKSRYSVYPSLFEIKNGGIYSRDINVREISMDLDMKRKPIKESLIAEYVEIDGCTYEVAHIETVPYQDSDEMKLYKDVMKNMKCLKTVSEWLKFFDAVEMKKNGCNKLPTSDKYSWKILCDCITGYKAGLWDIPFLNQAGLSVDEKCKWIDSFNSSTEHIYGKQQWERASEKSVQAKVLPFSVVRDTLALLQM